MRDFLNEIKWAYQRVKRGYDDRIMWELDGYFEQFIPSIKDFCNEQLSDKEHMSYNPERKEVFEKTVELIKDYEIHQESLDDYFEYPNSQSRLWSYIGDKIGYFWD
jgi:hypothetical protein